MMEYEPINLTEDSRHLINEVMEVGRLAGTLVSRAAVQYGPGHEITDAFDKVAQRLTVALLDFQVALKEIEVEA